MQPNKTNALEYIDRGGKAPARYAHVLIDHRASVEPYYAGILVGPLPIVNGTTQWTPLEYPYTRKTNGRVRNIEADEDLISRDWLLEISRSVSDITLSLWNATYLGLDNDTIGIRGIDPLSQEQDRVTRRDQFWNVPTSDFDDSTLLPLGLYVHSDVTGRDPSKWKLLAKPRSSDIQCLHEVIFSRGNEVTLDDMSNAGLNEESDRFLLGGDQDNDQTAAGFIHAFSTINIVRNVSFANQYNRLVGNFDQFDKLVGQVAVRENSCDDPTPFWFHCGKTPGCTYKSSTSHNLPLHETSCDPSTAEQRRAKERSTMNHIEIEVDGRIFLQCTVTPGCPYKTEPRYRYVLETHKTNCTPALVKRNLKLADPHVPRPFKCTATVGCGYGSASQHNRDSHEKTLHTTACGTKAQARAPRAT
ncbi:uncharacterized protein N7477_003932 [Penicillium maclennaniae]|uniref:uncharacterized protein n=1 Tax=Penicillium maclennaniae TaxID=1343394 RepID=UPI0025413B4C|nr:uncharacterized protein N7477_003932 [Penicillium maclennaniae]KAJ5678299.1 hypothetical protein N7477_003932 [Penicillium maclennaniae]